MHGLPAAEREPAADAPLEVAVYRTRISLDEKWTDDEDAWSNDRTKSKSQFHLDAGWHPLKLDFAQRGKLPSKLSVEWEGPGITREPVPGLCFWVVKSRRFFAV